jgi:hypothetical protein
MPPALAWCLRDLPRGFTLTQSEAAASIGVDQRQLRRIEIALRAKMQAMPEVRELAREFGILPRATGGCAPDVRLPDANVQNGSRAPCAFPWSGPTPPSCGVTPRAGHAVQRKVSPMTTMTDCTSASERVYEIERLALGDPSAGPLITEATDAIAAERDAARAIIFKPDIVPASQDVLSLFAWHTARLTTPAYAEKLADLHRRAMTSCPALCTLIRSPEAIADVEHAAETLAVPANPQESYTEAGARAAAAARAKFERAIAEQFAAAGGDLAAPAREYLAALALETRLIAARQRYEEHARTEPERQAAALAAAALAAEQQIEADRQAAARQAAERAAAAEIERQAVEADTASKLAQLDAAVAAERQRVLAVATLRHRLRLTTATKIRVGRETHRPAELAAGLDGLTIEACAAHQRAIDDAERMESRAS